MDVQITGTNIELPITIQRYVERKIKKLDKHLPGIIETKIEVSEEKTRSPKQHYLVKATLNSSIGGATFHGEERGEDLYKAIDKVASIMTRQLENHKGKLYHKGRGGSSLRIELSKVAQQSRPDRRVVKTKRFAVKPMSLEEATEQMELLEHDFFLYFDSDTEKVKLLYLRNDGNYGLIEPEFG